MWGSYPPLPLVHDAHNTPRPQITLAALCAPCYTPAAVSALLSQPSKPRLLLTVQAEELRAASWQAAISEMAAIVTAQAGLPSAQPLIDSALLREDCEPTYLGKEMALPHARVEGLPCAAVCVAHSVAGIPWHEGTAHLIIFLAVPEEAPELYLHVLSRVIRWRLRLEDTALRCPLLPAAAWEQELHRLLAL